MAYKTVKKGKGNRSGGASRRSVQRRVRHPAEIMLEWVAEFVTEINELESKKGFRVEMIAEDSEEMEIIRRTAGTRVDALGACILAGMKKFRTPNHGPQ